MQGQGSGSIVNIVSIMAPQARKTISVYTTSKAGVVGLTKALSVELRPEGIRCNGIAPGYFATEMNTALVKDPDFTSFISGRTPMQRWGDPDELGEPPYSCLPTPHSTSTELGSSSMEACLVRSGRIRKLKEYSKKTENF